MSGCEVFPSVLFFGHHNYTSDEHRHQSPNPSSPFFGPLPLDGGVLAVDGWRISLTMFVTTFLGPSVRLCFDRENRALCIGGLWMGGPTHGPFGTASWAAQHPAQGLIPVT